MKAKYPDDLTKDQRDALGMVFTRDFLADFMVERAFAFMQKSDPKGKATSPIILEPSVGGGSFYLALLRQRSLENEFLRGLYGLDIQSQAVSLARQNIRQYLRDQGIKQQDQSSDQISRHIFQGDFLTLDKTKLPFLKGEAGADLIIGNPPYIGEKGNKELFRKTKETAFGKHYYEKGMDYFYFFIEKGLELLKENGILAFITTSYWTGADSANKLRQAVRQQAGFLEVIDFADVRLFSDAQGHNSMIFLLQKGYQGAFRRYALVKGKQRLAEALKQIVNNSQQSQGDTESNDHREPPSISRSDLWHIQSCHNEATLYFSPYFIFMPEKEERLIRLMVETGRQLKDVATVNQGIVSGADIVTKRNIRFLSQDTVSRHAIKEGDGIFVLTPEEVERLEKQWGGAPSFVVPFYKNSQVQAYNLEQSQRYLLYLTGKEKEDHPWIQGHLKKFRKIMEQRRETRSGAIPYYGLHWSRKQSIFTGEKILVPQRARRPQFAYSNQPVYASADLYFIHRFKTDPFYLLGYLNSSVVERYLTVMGKHKGIYHELYARPLKELPILSLSMSDETRIADLAREIYEQGGQQIGSQNQKEIDRILERY